MNYTGNLGFFDNEWKNPPAPFNPKYDPKAAERYKKVTSSMVRDDFYANHIREECAAEWRKRYEDLKAKGE